MPYDTKPRPFFQVSFNPASRNGAASQWTARTIRELLPKLDELKSKGIGKAHIILPGSDDYCGKYRNTGNRSQSFAMECDLWAQWGLFKRSAIFDDTRIGWRPIYHPHWEDLAEGPADMVLAYGDEIDLADMDPALLKPYIDAGMEISLGGFGCPCIGARDGHTFLLDHLRTDFHLACLSRVAAAGVRKVVFDSLSIVSWSGKDRRRMAPFFDAVMLLDVEAITESWPSKESWGLGHPAYVHSDALDERMTGDPWCPVDEQVLSGLMVHVHGRKKDHDGDGDADNADYVVRAKQVQQIGGEPVMAYAGKDRVEYIESEWKQ